MGSRVSRSTDTIIVEEKGSHNNSHDSRLSLENFDTLPDVKVTLSPEESVSKRQSIVEVVTAAAAALLQPPHPGASRRRRSSAVVEDEAFIEMQWSKADLNHDAALTKKELALFLHRFNIKLKGGDVELMLEKFGESGGQQTINKQQFAALLHSLHNTALLDHLFEKLIDDSDHQNTVGPNAGPTMSARQLQAFLATMQQENVSIAAAAAIIAKCEQTPDNKPASSFSPDGLHSYLSSPELNGIGDPQCLTKVYQDMHQPFTHYFIASSHNTYLMGDQLMGTSSVQAYKDAFAAGCKCVELDCWDNAVDLSNPVIYHGHTLTSKIFFLDACIAIRDYGFSVSPYPVILSLEVHCKAEGQRALVRILKEVFDEMIPEPFSSTGCFPPPAQLLNKVLIMAKNFADDDEDELEELCLEDFPAGTNDGDLVPSKLLVMPAEGDGGDPKQSREQNQPQQQQQQQQQQPPRKKGPPPRCTLQQSGSIVKVKALADIKDSDPWILGNMSEKSLNRYIANCPADLREYNSRHVCRIYPRGLRVDSSNFDPQPAWLHGCAIVCLNYQTAGEPMYINNGKFADNGMCGYVLKPPHLRTPIAVPPPRSISTTLVLTIISAQRLPKASGTELGSVVDPYVRVSISGADGDCRVCTTRAISNNGFNPVWEQTFEFPLRCPDMAVLMFIVKDKDKFSDDFIGQYALPVPCVRPGYRAVPLRNKKGKALPKGSLFVGVEFRAPKPGSD